MQSLQDGFSWGKEIIEAFCTLGPSRQRKCGLCFSDEGRPWAIGEVQEVMQTEMSVLVDNADEITTYSWRRVAFAVTRAQQPLPYEDCPVTDCDLHFVAAGYRAVGALRELKRRWQGVTLEHSRSQPPRKSPSKGTFASLPFC